MTNLILHKKEEEVIKPWERTLMSMDTNSTSTNILRSNRVNGILGSKKKLLNEAPKMNVLINPMVESFLSFNINNNTTAAFNQNSVNNGNATFANKPGENLFDQTLFTVNDD